MIDLTALATEIADDPAALGYGPLVTDGDDQGIADLLNAADEARPQFRLIESSDVVGATDPAEWSNLSVAEKQRYQTIVSAGQVDPRYQHVRAAFGAMFPSGSATRDALMALAQRPGSRAEQLFGEGAAVSHVDVAEALGRT